MENNFYHYWSVIGERLAGYGSTPTTWVNSEEKEREIKE